LPLFDGPEIYEAYRTIFKKVAGSYGFDLPPWEKYLPYSKGALHCSAIGLTARLRL
jgi:hypothetical protein